jgi:hypothetical protein
MYKARSFVNGSFLLSAAVAALAVACAEPAMGQNKSAKETFRDRAMERLSAKESSVSYGKKNSPFCDYTYFTNAADNLDFKGTDIKRCFDLKGGDDVMILNRDAFPEGVRVYTGSGRDTVWTTGADDLVRDADGNDKEIRTFEGDDRIVMEVPLDEDPYRGVESTERTDIYPGAGRNTIEISKEMGQNAFARYSPNIWLWTESDARDQLAATCGRQTLAGDFDVRSMEVPETSSVAYDIDGCNIGIFGLYGDADVNMLGGRLAVQTYTDGYRVPSGDNLPRLTGQVSGGLALMLDINKSDPQTAFFWEGSGSALFRSRMSKDGSGGDFTIRSGQDILFQGDMGAQDVGFDLAAQGVVKLDLTSNGIDGRTRFNMAASRMDVAWQLVDEGRFPEITNDVPVSYMETTFIIPEIDWSEKTETPSQVAALSSITDPDSLAVESLPEAVPDVQTVETETLIAPGNTRLTLHLRQGNDRFAKCVAVQVLDYEKVMPDVQDKCLSAASPLKEIVIDEAENYDAIVITGDGVDLSIPINQASHFNVERIEVEF